MDQPASKPAASKALRQEQFLTVLSRDEARRRFVDELRPRPLGSETLGLDHALGRVLAEDLVSPGDVPPFDRSGVDGFAVRSMDTAAASNGTPLVLRLNGETIACGVAPLFTLSPGTATPIATGGPLPRGADAVVMIEHTEASECDASVMVRRASAPGEFVAFAGSDISRGEALLRRGTILGSREIGMLAACGIASLEVVRKPRVGVLSTGDELVAAGEPLRPAAIHDANGPITCAAVAENGCEPVFYGAVPDDETALDAAIRTAFAACDAVILSGGTSKGAGDLTYRLVGRLGRPGIVAHGVALKPGKPLCLAVCDGKPVIVLPGFPTSAMFTFHDMVAPVLRQMAGLPERTDAQVTARVPVRVASEHGRTEFVMVALKPTGSSPSMRWPIIARPERPCRSRSSRPTFARLIA
jgi:putative molybdopterin biosynthesis protein